MGKIEDDVTMKKTKYTLKLGCVKDPKVIVGLTTQENWIESGKKGYETFLFHAESGIFFAGDIQICRTREAKKDSSIEFLHDNENGNLSLKIDKREVVLLVKNN